MSLNRKDVKPGGSVFSIFVLGKAKEPKVSVFSTSKSSVLDDWKRRASPSLFRVGWRRKALFSRCSDRKNLMRRSIINHEGHKR